MSALQELPWGLGLIEGFYGRAWQAADRLATLGFLARHGYRYYVYAPKSDPILRRAWRERWTRDDEALLRDLARRADAEGILWGVGLSPLGLVEDMGATAMGALRAKIRLLDELGVQVLCILFDDMPRGVEDLAARQCAVVAEVAAVSAARHLLVCPSYYTRDPVLERLFGARPEHYWEELGAGLPGGAGIFWTGERVCSSGYPEADLRDIGARLGRAPVLWDNYPVNDGARMADFLHMDAFRDRDAGLRTLTGAHFVNPMNQCRLSWVPLATLPRAYAEGGAYDPERELARAAREVAGAQGGDCLVEDLELLQRVGLKALADADRARLRARYAGYPDRWAQELLDWLDGGYAFDPACLTD